jgi:hypothetical protein
MKKLFLILTGLALTYSLSAQKHGITYQAVIIDKNPQEIPGVDITGNYLPNYPLTVRFTIQDTTGKVEYQETQQTKTDKFGIINLTIGLGVVTSASPNVFREIDWNGNGKDLKVEISLGEATTNFTELSFQSLYFVPYAFHRNITATGTMIIEGASTINDQVTINADLNGSDSNFDAYPLRVEGGNQGIGIKIDGSRGSSNNFVTFWDDNGIQGRIEGQVASDVYNDPQYIYDQAMFAGKTAAQAVNIASAALASVLDPGNVVIEAANSALLIAEIAGYEVFAFSNLGVAYESGSGDYAEWLPRLNPEEKIEFGQIVGVYGGKITKKTIGAEQVMVVSKSPIVLGNMPPDSISEKLCEKVAFMGQVPVRVLGKVKKGDYIISMNDGSGLGIAVAPSKLTIDLMSSIVGRSWTESAYPGINFVNTAVGLKTNEWINILRSEEEKADSLKKEIANLTGRLNKSDEILCRIVPGYKEALASKSDNKQVKSTGTIPSEASNLSENKGGIVIEKAVTRESIIDNFAKTAAFLRSQGVDLSKNKFYTKLETDPEYKEYVINTIINANNSNKNQPPVK